MIKFVTMATMIRFSLALSILLLSFNNTDAQTVPQIKIKALPHANAEVDMAFFELFADPLPEDDVKIFVGIIGDVSGILSGVSPELTAILEAGQSSTLLLVPLIPEYLEQLPFGIFQLEILPDPMSPPRYKPDPSFNKAPLIVIDDD